MDQMDDGGERHGSLDGPPFGAGWPWRGAGGDPNALADDDGGHRDEHHSQYDPRPATDVVAAAREPEGSECHLTGGGTCRASWPRRLSRSPLCVAQRVAGSVRERRVGWAGG